MTHPAGTAVALPAAKMPSFHDFFEVLTTGVAVAAIAGCVALLRRGRTRDAALLDSERRFAQVFRAMPVGLTIVRRGGEREWLEVNDAFARLLGRRRADLIGMNTGAIGLMPADELAQLRAEYDAHGGRLRARGCTFRVRGGEERRVLFSSEPIVLDGEEVLLTMSLDVTDAVEAEEQRRASDERFRQIAEGIKEVFWLTSPSLDRVFYVSPSYETVWGLSAEDLYASPRSWMEAIHPDDRERVRTCARPDGVYAADYRIVRPDGSVRFIHDRGFPVKNEAGDVIRIAGFAEDVTESRKLEDEMREAQKMECVGRLAGGVAHDFNNLLTVIASAVEVLDESLDDEGREVLDEVRQAVTRAGSLTRQLLAFSRHQIVEPRVLDLNALVADTEKLLRRLVGEDIAVETDLSEEPCHVCFDAGQLVQVLMNLAVNARDAMPGGGTLTFSTHVSDAGPVLSVKDTGTGMSAEVLSRIFEPFFTTKGVGEGTGLGLAVIRGIVDQAGGSIDVDTAPGAGATFHISLPCAAREAPRPAPRPRRARLFESAHVLVVEDDASVRKLTARILREHGFSVETAADGEEAMRVLALQQPVDLLVTDVVMPGINGRELADAARRVRGGLGVLYVSGYTDDEVLRRGVVHHEVDLLQKPFSREELVARVCRVLDGKTGLRTAEA